MKLDLKIDPSLPEVEVTVRAPARTPELDALMARITAEETHLLGFREDGSAVMLETDAVLRFYGEDGDVQAQTARETFRVRQRLYELEKLLEGRPFVRISRSEIVNLKQVTSLDLKLTGTICMTLDRGTAVCYVSRRYVRKIREVLGV